MPAQRNDFSGKTAGGYNGGFLAEFLFNPVYHAVDAGRIAIESAALHKMCIRDRILIMIIRGHMVYHAAQRICLAVVADIHDQIQIIAAHRRLDLALCLAGTKSRCVCPDDVGVSLIT